MLTKYSDELFIFPHSIKKNYSYCFQVQWTQEDQEDYCDQLLYLVTFSLLMIGWVVLVVTFLVFLADKIFNKLLCCSLCSSINNKQVEPTFKLSVVSSSCRIVCKNHDHTYICHCSVVTNQQPTPDANKLLINVVSNDFK